MHPTASLRIRGEGGGQLRTLLNRRTRSISQARTKNSHGRFQAFSHGATKSSRWETSTQSATDIWDQCFSRFCQLTCKIQMSTGCAAERQQILRHRFGFQELQTFQIRDVLHPVTDSIYFNLPFPKMLQRKRGTNELNDKKKEGKKHASKLNTNTNDVNKRYEGNTRSK